MKNILRRSFIWKVGTAASAALVSTTGLSIAKADTGTTSNLPLQAALLEEEKVLRKFHQAFEQAINNGRYEEVTGMFAQDSEERDTAEGGGVRVVFNGGVFKVHTGGIRRLYRERFPAGKIGRRMEPAPGFELTDDQQHDSVEVSSDLRSPKAVFPYSIEVGMPFQTESSLAAMARLHGEGVRLWWEGGVYHIDYRKDADGRWKIRRLEYDTLSRADYRAGKSYAQPIFVSRLVACFPADPHGPDELV